MPSLNLLQQFVVMDIQKCATSVEVTPSLYQNLDKDFDNFKGCELIASYQFDEDWPSWEMHPKGDEIVLLLTGEATLILEVDGEQRPQTLSQLGDYVVVPKGVWHTAKVNQPTTMLFITPGEGTQHKPF